MRGIKLALIRILPWVTRYFVVGNKVPLDRIESGVATLVRKKGRLCSCLYLAGLPFLPAGDEPVPDTEFFWGRWLDVDMTSTAPQVREVDELEAFMMIRRASP